MHVSEFIGRHLIGELHVNNDRICAICGRIGCDDKYADVLSGNFNDYQYLKYKSEYMCKYCSVCISSNGFHGNSLRNYSVIATNNSLDILKHDDIHNVLLNIPTTPFVIIVTYSNKKHIFFHAKITEDIDKIYVATDRMDLTFSHSQYLEVFKICDELYNVVGLSKNDIIRNVIRWKNVEEYGIEKYYSLAEVIKKFYFTEFLRFVVYTLVKKEIAK